MEDQLSNNKSNFQKDNIEKFSIEEIEEQILQFKQREEKEKTKTRILYLDDEEKALVTFKAAFRREYEVFTANTPNEARDILAKQEVEVIISDQRMPLETGVEFLASIIPEYPKPMRILLTAYSDIDAVIRAINEGKIYYYMSKPYRNEEMRKVIENSVEVHSLRNAKIELTQVALRANEQLEFLLRQKLLS